MLNCSFRGWFACFEYWPKVADPVPVAGAVKETLFGSSDLPAPMAAAQGAVAEMNPIP